MFSTPDKASRVLIVRAGALGDTLMVTPAIRALSNRYPGAKIDFLCSAAGSALLASNPYLSDRLVLRHRNLPYYLSVEKRSLVKSIRSRQYDFAVLLESASRYRKLLERAGIAHIRSFLETPFDPALHSVVNYLRVCGFPDPRSINTDTELPIAADVRNSVENRLRGLPRPIVAIHPGYGPSNKKKDQSNRLRGWSSEKFARVADKLLELSGGAIVFTGSNEDEGLCKSIAASLPPARVRVLAGSTSIPEFAAAIGIADLLISVDSSSAHIAAAIGTPTVVLWGPAILHQTRPVSSTTPIAILQKPVPCAPCYGTPQMKSCRRNICMEQIEPEEVVEKATQLLARNNLRVLPD